MTSTGVPGRRRPKQQVVVDTVDDAEFVTMLRASVSKLARSARAERQRDLRALPFSLSSVLSTLDRVGPMTATQLASLEAVRKPSIARALAALEERGLVRREAHASDARQQVVHITAQGVKTVRESRRIVDDWYRARLAQLTDEDVANIDAAAAALRRLADDETHAVSEVKRRKAAS